MLKFEMKHPEMTEEHLGLIPMFLSPYDPDPAAKQINDNYQHGGGWRPFQGFIMLPDGGIRYGKDPVLQVLAEAKLRDEIIRFYDSAWVSITQPDGSYEISRVD